ncbi:MAG: pilus assembly FimT family protein [Chthoniobacterales bacterium]
MRLPFLHRSFPRRAAFTLLELIVVVGIIILLLAVTLPSITSLSKSGSRKAAVGALVGAFEQARAQAIKDGLATYVVFPTFPSGATQTTSDRYNHKSYAIFEDDPANAATPKQLTNWKTLSTGVAVRTGSLGYLTDVSTLSPALKITFAPDTAATPLFRCVKFNANGEVDSPSGAPSFYLTIFEGSVTNGTELITSAKDGSNNPKATETVTISRLTGRATGS